MMQCRHAFWPLQGEGSVVLAVIQGEFRSVVESEHEVNASRQYKVVSDKI